MGTIFESILIWKKVFDFSSHRICDDRIHMLVRFFVIGALHHSLLVPVYDTFGEVACPLLSASVGALNPYGLSLRFSIIRIMPFHIRSRIVNALRLTRGPVAPVRPGHRTIINAGGLLVSR